MFVGDDQTASTSAVYGLTTKARCISAVIGDPEKERFLVGTLSLKEENEVHLVEVQEEENDIKCLQIYNHPSEIWWIEPSPSDPLLFFSCYNSISNSNVQSKTSMWKMKEDDPVLQEQLELKGHVGDIKGVRWNPSESTEVVSLDEHNIRFWKIDKGVRQVGSLSIGDSHKFTTVCWNPLHPEQIATTNETHVRGWDLRILKESYSIPSAHIPFVRDLDFNPNKDYYLVTGGDDHKMKFWDTRKYDKPVKSFLAHSHWVWNVKYNRYHDQLVISSGTDSFVSLWNVASISSSPNSVSSKKTEDHLIKSFEEHEDSVYCISWGTSAWVFSSLSYDGRVVVNYVPKEYRDLILL